MYIFDLIVLGAGGAGLFCAGQTGQSHKSVLVLDHNSQVGRKILISGGGRCNFTNLEANAKAYVSENMHFAKSALANYSAKDFIKLVEKHGIAYHEKKLGQLFCNNSAREIVDLLMDECQKGKVKFSLETKIFKVERQDKHTDNPLFLVHTNCGNFQGRNLVVATGGLSIPQIGATGFGYELAKQFALPLVATQPALDGFVMKEDNKNRLDELSGVAVDSLVKIGKASFRENILFTHKGLSGPAALQASLFFKPGQALIIDLTPDLDLAKLLLQEKRAGNRQDIKNILCQLMPRRLAEHLCQVNNWHGNLLGLAESTIEKLALSLQEWTLYPKSTVGYTKAEVTRGGVSTECLSSKTMEVKSVPGLYFIGEVVDVTGMLGGYNFQWAWASAMQASRHITGQD